jgi:TRAP-type C4-dicarboxylate transport system substrate-binding protein
LRIRAPSELLGVLHDLGADPVNMPMGDVYSALAKGVIDGVIAPMDTFRSLHFAEVAHWYTALSVPRGAYPARAMAKTRWQQLSDADRRVLEESIPVWEAALARQTRQAQLEGLEAARAGGVQELPIDPAEQRRFDALYLAEARRGAQELARFGIDGLAVFETARRCEREIR